MNLDAVTGFFSHVPTDWIIIAVFAIFVGFDTVRSGSGRAVALALSLPAALFLTDTLPHASILTGLTEQFSSPVLKAVLFGIVFVATYLLVRRMSASYRTGSGEVMQSLMAGTAAIAVVVVVWLQVPELQSVWSFGPQVQAVFGEAYRFWWIALSYTTLALVTKEV